MKKWQKRTLTALTIITFILAILGIQLYRNIGGLPDEAQFADLPYYQNGQFRNLHETDLPYYPDRATGKGGFIRHNDYTPKTALPMILLNQNSFGPPEAFAYYWLGHATSIIELDGLRLLTDPVFDNAAPLNLPFLVPRIQAAPIERDHLPHIDIVLITHDHYDHLEAATIRHLAHQAKHFIVPLGVGARLKSWGVPADKITELGWEQSTQIGSLKITAETALHYSARWTNDRNKTLWASFVIEGTNHRLYWGGDTGYGKHFADIGQKYGHFDIAFLEIDAANAGWPKTHMFAHQSVQAAIDLRAQSMIPIHWGVFSLGRNAWNVGIKQAHTAAQTHHLRLDIPKMGEKYQAAQFKNDDWWNNPALLRDGQ